MFGRCFSQDLGDVICELGGGPAHEAAFPAQEVPGLTFPFVSRIFTRGGSQLRRSHNRGRGTVFGRTDSRRHAVGNEDPNPRVGHKIFSGANNYSYQPGDEPF